MNGQLQGNVAPSQGNGLELKLIGKEFEFQGKHGQMADAGNLAGQARAIEDQVLQDNPIRGSFIADNQAADGCFWCPGQPIQHLLPDVIEKGESGAFLSLHILGLPLPCLNDHFPRR